MNSPLHKNLPRRFSQCEKALLQLEAMLKETNRPDYFDDALIQRFEFTLEMFWKLLRMVVAGITDEDPAFPKQTFTLAFQAKLIDQPHVWENMLKDRNTVAHTYDENYAHEVAQRVPTYAQLMRTTFDQLQLGYNYG